MKIFNKYVEDCINNNVINYYMIIDIMFNGYTIVGKVIKQNNQYLTIECEDIYEKNY